ncbi:uncharacterized protein KD926_007050 [Aspergillus affinis]|uniref:uncharacterized protein n=1 Tax=Aspergillus affinis TaxID=1070780 RepID=UPI0022FEF79E|nr:uncharacterized protein KD926_007050 [Aspergillus affinis]KAI9045749.1 hypothetical protein KD926_007050 [Aspergillus affinis]
MDLVNERDQNGNITKAAPTFDYIENKAIEEEHRKGQLRKHQQNKNPRLKDQKKHGKSHKSNPGNSHPGRRKPLKRRPSTDDEDDDIGGPRDPKKPTFMATKASGEDVNKAFGKDVEGNFALRC